MIYDRTYGVEIECILPRGIDRAAVANALTAADVPAYDAGYTHAVSRKWKIVSDISVGGNGNGTGMELVSPPLSGESGHAQIIKVCEVLNRLGATVNHTCGLHVHVLARELSGEALRKLALLYMVNENVIDTFVPKTRRANLNQYCQSLSRFANRQQIETAESASTIATAIKLNAAGNPDRFMKLNYTAFWKYGTVEFRQHSGTVNATKINAWVLFCLRMVEAAAQVQGGTTTPRPANRRLGIIYDMMAQPGGVSRRQVAERLGRDTLPPMNRILRQAGIAYREYRKSHEAFYELVGGVAVAAEVDQPAFDSLASLLGMTELEKSWWQSRRTELERAN